MNLMIIEALIIILITRYNNTFNCTLIKFNVNFIKIVTFY